MKGDGEPEDLGFATVPAADLVALALRRQPPADHLRPALRLAVREARTSPLEFARLVLEEARELALREPHQGEKWLSQARELLAAARLETLDAARARDLEALGWIYLGDARRVLSHHLEAETCFETARTLLACGSGSAEIAATCEELRAQLLRAQGNVEGALELLARAESRLQAPGLEGRRAEVLGRRGALLLRLEEEPGALEATERALALLPSGQSLELRLFLLHNCAAGEQRLGLLEAAAAHLAEAEPLYGPHGSPLLRAQNLWMRGRVEIASRRFEAAETSLQTSLQRFLELGLTRHAVRVLFDLGRLYLVAGWKTRWRDLEATFDQLREAPELQEVLVSLLHELRRLGRRKGVETPYVEGLLQKAEPPKLPTH